MDYISNELLMYVGAGIPVSYLMYDFFDSVMMRKRIELVKASQKPKELIPLLYNIERRKFVGPFTYFAKKAYFEAVEEIAKQA